MNNKHKKIIGSLLPIIFFVILWWVYTNYPPFGDTTSKSHSDYPVINPTTVSTSSEQASSTIATPTPIPAQTQASSSGMDQLYADALAIDVSSLPSDTYAIMLNNGEPYFTDDEISIDAYEYYSPLDEYGRCGYAMACLSTELQPAEGETRESISNVRPSGWHSYEAHNVDGGWLYNRSHLIGWQLTAENANECNLITGTRQFNVEGMLPQEMLIDDLLYYYPEIHIMYRVTPIYEGNNLVANGVVMEAFSVEDNGGLVTYCFFIPNIQESWEIDYATGEAYRLDNNLVDLSYSYDSYMAYDPNTNELGLDFIFQDN